MTSPASPSIHPGCLRRCPHLAVMLGLAALAIGAAGCSSVRDMLPARMQQRLEGTPEQVREVPGEPREVFDRARAALDEMNFTLMRGGPAQGRIEALGGVQSDLRGARQLKLVATFDPGLPGSTRVGLTFFEIIEGDAQRSPGLATEAVIADTPLYAIFLRQLGYVAEP